MRFPQKLSCKPSHLKRLGLFFGAVCIAVCLSILHASPQGLSILFDREALIDFFSMSRYCGACLFVVAHVVANAIGVPGTLLVIVGGAVYGLWWGALWSVVGATLGAIAAFWLARTLLHDWFKRRFYHHPLLKKLNRMLHSNSLQCVLTVRFSPISPFNVVNFAFGLTPVSTLNYGLGTFIGIIPGTLAYTWLGVTGIEAMSSGQLGPLIVCLLLLMILSALPILWQQRQQSP